MGSRRVHTQKRATNVYLALRFLEAALLMLFFVVSLVLAGGQVSASRDPSWGVIVDFPVFTLPGWLMLGISVLGALAAIPVLLLARVTDAGARRRSVRGVVWSGNIVVSSRDCAA